MLPVIIIAVIAVALVVVAFVTMQRSRAAGEHPSNETDADRLRTEQEFEEAERYQAELREKEHGT